MQEISRYWDKQSAIWSEEKKEAWSQPVTQRWLTYFKDLLPKLKGNKVLEVGTASGYFANILAMAGYEVAAVDISPAMIDEARAVSADLNLATDYRVMDAQQLDFAANSFDLVFTRLMTWTTPDVEAFYREVYKMLRPGGLLLNFDGDFGNYTFTQEGHEKYPADIMEQANIIKSRLDISRHKRPERDIAILQQCGFVNVQADLTTQAGILDQDSSDLFLVQAVKPVS